MKMWIGTALSLGALSTGAAMAQVPEPNYSPTYEPVVTEIFWYRVAPVPGGKRFQPVLLTAGKEELVAAYRPDPSGYQFIDRKVRVTGRRYHNSPFVQTVSGTHFEIQAIELAPGQIPRPGPYSMMPAPPMVRKLAELAPLSGAYLSVVGTLEAAKKSGFRWQLSARLPDGALRLEAPGAVSRRLPEIGKKYTFVIRQTGETIRCLWFCPGENARCGMQPRARGHK